MGRLERIVVEQHRLWSAREVAFEVALAAMPALNLRRVVMPDVGQRLLEDVDELHGREVGDAWQQHGDDEGDALHWTSSTAHWTCSAVT